MQVVVILMITSRGSSILGSGTVSTRTSLLPCQQSALMDASSRVSVGPSRVVPSDSTNDRPRSAARPVGHVLPVDPLGPVRPAAPEPLRTPIVQGGDPGDGRERRGEVPFLGLSSVNPEPRAARSKASPATRAQTPALGCSRAKIATPVAISRTPKTRNNPLLSLHPEGPAKLLPAMTSVSPRPMLNQPRPRATFISFMILSSLV